MAPPNRSSRRLLYWDSCIFIAWLKDEKRPNHEMDGVQECVENVMKGHVTLMTSVMTRTEVFDADLSEPVRRAYDGLLSRRNVQLVDQDLRVADLARDIRAFYVKLHATDNCGKVAAADAVHLATAIHYNADEFHTFDNGGRGGRSLLSLNGDVAGRHLKICRPPLTQARMPW